MTRRDAVLYEKLPCKRVRCDLCPRRCVLEDTERGYCTIRYNCDGQLRTHYGLVTGLNATYIEFYGLFHFFPRARVLEVQTPYCQTRCSFCAAKSVSFLNEIPLLERYVCSPQYYPLGGVLTGSTRGFSSWPENGPKKLLVISPEEVVAAAEHWYRDGVVFGGASAILQIECLQETYKLAHENGLFNVLESSGYITKEAINEIAPFLDAVVIGIKNNGCYYKKFTDIKNMKPIYDSILTFAEKGVHVEITNTIISKKNLLNNFRKLTRWIHENLGSDAAFHSCFDVYQNFDSDLQKKLKRIGREEGLNYVYVRSRMFDPEIENTYCPFCGFTVIERIGVAIPYTEKKSFHVPYFGLLEFEEPFSFLTHTQIKLTTKVNLKKGRCPECGAKIPIIY